MGWGTNGYIGTRGAANGYDAARQSSLSGLSGTLAARGYGVNSSGGLGQGDQRIGGYGGVDTSPYPTAVATAFGTQPVRTETPNAPTQTPVSQPTIPAGSPPAPPLNPPIPGGPLTATQHQQMAGIAGAMQGGLRGGLQGGVYGAPQTAPTRSATPQSTAPATYQAPPPPAGTTQYTGSGVPIFVPQGYGNWQQSWQPQSAVAPTAGNPYGTDDYGNAFTSQAQADDWRARVAARNAALSGYTFADQAHDRGYT